jgi:aminopeptidase N
MELRMDPICSPSYLVAGMDLYFKRHDGCAVTCDDFRAAMADANGVDLSAMSTWYSQAGTPNVDVTTHYNAGMLVVTDHEHVHASGQAILIIT